MSNSAIVTFPRLIRAEHLEHLLLHLLLLVLDVRDHVPEDVQRRHARVSGAGDRLVGGDARPAPGRRRPAAPSTATARPVVEQLALVTMKPPLAKVGCFLTRSRCSG